MSKIIAVPPKSISGKDKEAAEKAGFIVIEIADPSKMIIMDESQIINGSDLAMVALETIVESNHSNDYLKSSFVTKLFLSIKKQRADKKA